MAENFKTRDDLRAIIDHIASAESPVGMDAVYVHALILEKLGSIERRLEAVEKERSSGG